MMLRLVTLLILLPLASVAQHANPAIINDSVRLVDSATGAVTLKHKSEVLRFADRMPEPPYDLYKYLSTHIDYPRKARKEKIRGKVMIRFVVDTDGTIIEPEVVRSVHPLLDAEALAVVTNMPKWKPGKQDGKPVKVYFSLPINFNLSEPDKK